MLKILSVFISTLIVSGSLISCSDLSKDNIEIAKTNDDIKLVNHIDYKVDISETNDINAAITQILTESNGNSTILLAIENISGTDFLYGQDFIIEKKLNEQWISVQPIREKVDSAILYRLSANNISYQMIDLGCYGTLDEGNYRLIKEFNSNGIVVNKSINFSVSQFNEGVDTTLKF